MQMIMRWVLRHRRAMLGLILAVTAVAAWSAMRIQIRFAFRDFFDYPGNPAVPVIDRYHDEFEDPGGFVAVLIEGDDVFKKDVLQYIDAVTKALQPEQAFSKIRSLTHIKVISGD